MKYLWITLIALLPIGQTNPEAPYLVVLGVAQDAGYPQVGCQKACCQPAWEGVREPIAVTSLGLVDPKANRSYLFEATPDLPAQVQQLQEITGAALPIGIFLTHAHIGHYTGLMYLGREAFGAQGLPVYTMPKMQEFLQQHGPWQQLVTLGNIALQPMRDGQPIKLENNITVTPLRVPHRDEYSETVGYRIAGPNRTALFIPDIDKWDRWDRDLETEIAKVDVALLDATFFDNGELPGRDMSEIPHPFVEETMAHLAHLPAAERQKVVFIHFNHTNPLLHPGEAR